MATKADAIKEALQAIAEANGGVLTPAAVVEAAKNQSSVLHDQFTWDLGAAAQERWLDQARTLIRSVRVHFTVESRVIKAPFYVRDPRLDSNLQGYTTLPRLLTDKEAARLAVVREMVLAEAAMERARSIAEVLQEDETVDSLILSAREYRRRIESGQDAPTIS